MFFFQNLEFRSCHKSIIQFTARLQIILLFYITAKNNDSLGFLKNKITILKSDQTYFKNIAVRTPQNL